MLDSVLVDPGILALVVLIIICFCCMKKKDQNVPSSPPAEEPTLPNTFTNPMAELDDTTKPDPKEKSWREKTMREIIQSRREQKK